MTYARFEFAMTWLVLFASVCGGSLAFGQESEDTGAVSPSAATALLTKYCFACHAGYESNGDVSIDTFDTQMVGGKDAEAWKSVLDVINSGDMPPEDAPQPSAEERRQLTHWLTSSLARVAEESKAVPADGVRRLTRAQYTNTLKDLLGVAVNFGDVLPEDGKSEMGFTNSGNVLQTSSLHVDYWEALARSALDKAIKTGPRPDALRLRVTFGEDIDSTQSTRSGAEVRGYQAIPIPNEHFKVDFLNDQGDPVEITDAIHRKDQRAKENVVGIGMRGSANDRFVIRPEGMLLHSAVPHTETTPKSWQGPSPNLKILYRDELPRAGDFRMRVQASKVTLKGKETYREGLISLRNDVPAPLSEATISLLARDSTSHKGMELDDDGVLSPTDLPKRKFARFTLNVPHEGLYQIDLVHPWASQDRMPSLELVIDRFREEQRLNLSDDDSEKSRITTPVTLAWLKKGKHRLRIGGRFFVGFEKVLVNPLSSDSPVTRNLRGEAEKNQTKFSSATPSLRAFAGTRTDDGMDYGTFDESKIVKLGDEKIEQLDFIGRLEDLPMPYYDTDSSDPLANIAIFGVWNNYLVKSRADSGPPVMIKSVEIEAPWFPVWPPPSHTKIFFKTPELDSGESGAESYTRAVLERFVSRAFRRPATPAEIDRYISFWNATKDDADNYHQSVKEVLVAVLCSPNFLFVIDQASSDGPNTSDAQFRLASKMSYFLWNSPPDQSLMALAKQGKLAEQKLGQVDRMLDDPKVWRMIRTFAQEWLRIDRHENIQTDVSKYPDFSRFVKSDMAEETFQFLYHVLKEDHPVSELIDSDYALLNQNLAEFYGVEGVIGSHFRPVSLNPELHRGGLLSQGAFLSGHSDGSQAHPIKRAVWLKEKILGETPPPPPPNVPDLDPETPGFEKLTLKQQLELHRDKPSCLNCHQKIDPYGVVFQNYDAVGRYQVKIEGKPVDAKSVLPDGTVVDGIDEMKQYILQNKRDEFLTSLVEHLFAWAIGRDVRFSDEQEIADIVGRVKKDGQTFRSVFRQIVLSESFSNSGQ